ncbi:MAG: caspase domain-containing protein [Bacteroidota bacterium]
MKTPFVILLIVTALQASSQNQFIEGTSNTILVSVGTKPVEVEPKPAVVETVLPPASNKAELEITLESLGITTLPKYYALIIGVSEYEYAGAGLPNLDKPMHDAENIYHLLTTKYAFQPEHVTLLKNATREDIINNFDKLANEVEEKDNLLVFYAGHGFYDKDKDFGYWLPSDAKVTSRAAWIANSTIKDYIGAINSKHTLLITDACFGGSIFKTRSVVNVLRRFHDLYKDNSRKALTSGNLTEVPDQSVFLKFLLKELEENQDPFLSASALYTRIYEPILNNTPSTPQFGTIQGAGDEGGDFFFIKKD